MTFKSFGEFFESQRKRQNKVTEKKDDKSNNSGRKKL